MEPLQAPEGEVVAEHAATWAHRLAALLLLVLPGVALVVLTTQLGPKDADARVPFLIGGPILVALGALAFLQQNKSRVVVRTDGVERFGLRGRLWALRFCEMRELTYRAVKVRVGGVVGLLLPALSTQVHIALVDPNGRKYKVPVNLKAMDVLAERVVEQQTTAQFPAARAQLDAGETVRFGKSLSLDGEKLSVRKLFGGTKSCPLAELEKFSVENGALRIRQRGKTFAFASVQTGRIPNVFVLLRLLESMPGQKPAPLGTGRDFTAQVHVA